MGAPKAKWIKLAAPQVSLNAPNVGNVCPMTQAFIIQWGTTNGDMVKKVPDGTRHVVFNCHGFGDKPEYPAHLAIGQTLKADNVAVCNPWYSITTLRCIWLSACNIGGTGLPLCKELARQTGCYVATQTMGVPDRRFEKHCVEDYYFAMPLYIDPFGEMVARADFMKMGKTLGFTAL